MGGSIPPYATKKRFGSFKNIPYLCIEVFINLLDIVSLQFFNFNVIG